MQEEIPTQVLTCPQSKKEIEIREWITGGDYEEIQAIYLKADRVGDVAQQADHRAFEIAIVRIGEVTEKDQIVKAVLALPVRDLKFISSEVEKIVNPLDTTEAEADAPSKK